MFRILKIRPVWGLPLRVVHGFAVAVALAAGMAHASDAPAAALRARSPMYIVPTVEGILFCDEARENKAQSNFEAAQAACDRDDRDGAPALDRLMEELEPGGAKGQVQVGYLMTVQLLNLYQPQGDGWAIDDRRVDAFLQVISKVDRPVVVYLQSTHFDSLGPLAAALMKDPKNLMQFSDGSTPKLGYFGYGINPYTLQTGENIPVNHYRFKALRHMAKRLMALPEPVRNRIVGFTLAGEVHQLFSDFESGTGAYNDIRVTDYSAASITGFRRALQARYVSIDQLNAAMGLQESAFDTIAAPSKDIRRVPLNRFSEHYDSWADGYLPIAGWMFDPENRVKGLELYVDGKLIGPVAWGFNRLDVYRAEEKITTPNVGFRHDLDFSAMTPGRHRAQVVALADGDRYLLSDVTFTVVGRDQAKVSDDVPAGYSGLKSEGAFARFRVFMIRVLRKLGFDKLGFDLTMPSHATLPGLRSWLDMPRSLQDVYYNPLAREWNHYRDSETRVFLSYFVNVAKDAGLPAEKIFSHQILPRVNSSWNPQLFAVDSTMQSAMQWRPGINLYGGATNSDWVRDYMNKHNLHEYGVPEFHPQQWKQPDVALKALRAQYDAGAVFISPFFFSIVPDRFKVIDGHGLNRVQLRPDNTNDGSAQFYQAIRDFARQ